MRPANPYSAGGLVIDPNMFFGRAEELKRIHDRLRKGDSTAVVGLRRIGKSSLLYQLAHQTEALPDQVIAVYLDLQDAAHHQPLGLLTAILGSLDKRLDNRYQFDPVERLADFSNAVKRMVDDGYRPVLCLDEVEELTDRPDFDDDFFEALRSLGNRRKLAFVTISGESLDVLLKRKRRTSPFYNLFINLDLAGLTDEAARNLLTRPFQQANLSPPTSDYLDYALSLAGHYPFYLQMLAYHMFEMRAAGRRMSQDQLRLAFGREAEHHFQGLWHHLSPLEQAGVKQLAGLPGHISDDLLDRMRRCGLVEGPPQQPCLFSDLFKQKVQQGAFERNEVARPGPSHDHSRVVRTVKATVSRPWQRWFLWFLGAVSGLALALWLIFGWPSQAATLDCAGGDYIITLDYPCYLATGDSGQIDWNLHNLTPQPITTTLSIMLPPEHIQIEGQNSERLENLNKAGAGQVSFHRRPPSHWFWQPDILVTPSVELKVNDTVEKCGGRVAPIQAGPIHGLNTFWAWLWTAGPLGWLLLAGLEWFKAMGEQQTDNS
jgi:hypothetical protein